MKTFLLICDLKDEPEAIEAYDKCHQAVPEPILESIQESGILEMNIFRWKNRLSMTLITKDDFSFEKKEQLDLANPKVQEWESFVGQYQQNLPGTPPHWKWAICENIFDFKTFAKEQ